jgi:hypothetical protein
MSNILGILRRFPFFSLLFVLLLAAHLSHSGVLWEGETLPLASAMQMAHGSILYRDIWFDKPLLVPAIYLLWGAKSGIALRIAGATYAFAASLLAFAVAETVWTEREGYRAAGLLAFFLTFDTHSAVLPLGADMLLLVPHLAAILLAIRKKPLWAGAAAGVGFLFNTKAVFVLAACALFSWPAIIPLAAGFVTPCLIALAWLAGTHSLTPYIDQVWHWPSLYASSPVVSNPVANGLVRTFNWLGFHAVLLIAAIALWWQREHLKFLLWAVLCYGGVILGWRFFPRYFLLLLVPMVIAGSRGLPLLKPRMLAIAALLTLSIPLIRFGPRYVLLANDLLHNRPSNWNDLALDQDSKDASMLALAKAKPGSTLYVWGYRPEMYIYTKMRAASTYLDCQALTGVPADRHLTQSTVVLTTGTAEARASLAQSTPDVLIDGLSLYNPALSPDHYPELRNWLGGYRMVGRTKGALVYVRSPHTIGK